MKVAREGWPYPTDWVNRLHREMAERQAVYDAEDVLGMLQDLPARRW
jgi:hypothetical protein